jgi:hypothetical protein
VPGAQDIVLADRDPDPAAGDRAIIATRSRTGKPRSVAVCIGDAARWQRTGHECPVPAPPVR